MQFVEPLKTFLACAAIVGGVFILYTLSKTFYVPDHPFSVVSGVLMVAAGVTFLWSKARFNRR